MKPWRFLVFLLLTGPWTGYLHAKDIIRMGTLAPKGSSWHKLLEQMAQRVERETDREVIVRIYPGGVVGDESEMIRKIRIGQLQAAAISNAGLGEIDPRSHALTIPMMFRDYQEWDYVRERINPILAKALQDKGFAVLTWSDIGWLHFFTKTAVALPDQLKKMKLATSASEHATSDIFKWAGFQPVPITVVDMMTGLQTGLIDSFYLPIILAESTQLFRHAPNMTDLKWAPLQGALILDAKIWASLTSEHRATISKAAAETGIAMRDLTRDQERQSLDAMKQRGLAIRDVDDAARAQWLLATQNAYPMIREKLVPAEMFDKIKGLVAEFRAARKTP